MNRRKLLKSIGTAGIGTGTFSNIAGAERTSVEEKEISESRLQNYLRSKPVSRVLDRLGVRIGRGAGNLSIEKATKSSVVVDNEALLNTIRVVTNFGTLGIIIGGDEVAQAIFAIDSDISDIDRFNRITSVKLAPNKNPAVYANSNKSIFVRDVTDDELVKIREHVSDTIESALVIDDHNTAIYKVTTRTETIKINVRKNTIISAQKLQNFELESESTVGTAASSPCSSSDIPGCMWDVMNSSAYCSAAGYACTLSIGGPAGVVACLAAIASLCGGQLVLAGLGGACIPVARCVQHHCNKPFVFCYGLSPF